MHFGQAPRFEILPDATIITRTGTQTNCGGIARIHVRITVITKGTLSFGPPYDTTTMDDCYGGAVPGCAVLEPYRQAIFQGAQAAFAQCDGKIGADFELLDALVHIVDACESRFKQAGFLAMKGWITTYFPSAWTEDTETEI